VRVTFDRVAIVRAVDPEAAKARALRWLGLLAGVLRDVKVMTRLMPEPVA
jgi:hypothetical protein